MAQLSAIDSEKSMSVLQNLFTYSNLVHAVSGATVSISLSMSFLLFLSYYKKSSKKNYHFLIGTIEMFNVMGEN